MSVFLRKLLASVITASLLVAQQGFSFSAQAAIKVNLAATSGGSSAAAAAGGVIGANSALNNLKLSAQGLNLKTGVLPSVNMPNVSVNGAVGNVETVLPLSVAAPTMEAKKAQGVGTVSAAEVPAAAPALARNGHQKTVMRRAARIQQALGKKTATELHQLFDNARQAGAENFVGAEESGAKKPAVKLKPAAEAPVKKRRLIEFRPEVIKGIKEAFRSSWTRPNKQDYTYLVTKTFGVNLAVRLGFVIQGVMGGTLPLLRAILSTTWYQAQDAVFTVFGQTYMKFLNKMTGLLRIHNAEVGDFLFIYTQLVFFEFLNRLVLGPLGANPLVYSWAGIGLIFLNIIQGMIAGGPLIPAINKMHKAGVIKHSTMMHLYQISSLTMHLGLFATFGFQSIFTLLSTILMFISWGLYLYFTAFYKPPPGAVLPDESNGL
ncbi:MAG: hypothetical protein ABIJ96_00165 [Elusimicrobiota bacterium]